MGPLSATVGHLGVILTKDCHLTQKGLPFRIHCQNIGHMGCYKTHVLWSVDDTGVVAKLERANHSCPSSHQQLGCHLLSLSEEITFK